MTAARSLCLLGRDYPDLGPIGGVSFPDGGAIALSRGAEPKTYDHVDPNEDGGLLVRMATGDVLAVTDGYNGAQASEVALEHVHGRAAALLTPDDEAFLQQVGEMVRQIGQALPPSSNSRTCLVVAAIADGVCRFASFGDSGLFRATHIEPVTLDDNRLVLGPNLARVPLPAWALWSGSFTPERDERIALVTDGVTNFLRDRRMLTESLRSAVSDADAAMGLVQQANARGAGDNTTAVVLRSG